MAEVDINQSYRWLGGIFRQVFSLQGDISPSQITADQDDYNPTGLSTAAILRLSTDATRNINGIAGGADGRIIKIVNVGTQGIVLKDEAGTSTAANRFALNSDVTISESQAVELWYDSTSSRWRLFGGTGGTTVVTPDQENGLVSGGTVTWIVNYDYEVSESFYYIDGVLYHSPRTTVTLNAADPTDDRIDLFVLTTSNTATKVTGVASTPPAEPSYDPSTQLKISFATVDNGTTQPTVTQTWIYRENAGTPTEWAYTDNTANLNPASTTNPYAGTIDIEGTSVAVNDYFELTPLTAPTFGTYDALVFKIRSKANWTNTRFITIRFYSGTTAVGSPAQLGGGSFGFDSTNTTDYQNVTIPLTTFGSFTTADRVRFIRTGSTGTIGFYIDDIQLMLTGTGGTTTLIPINGLLNATNVNTIENLNYKQEWQWNTLAGGSGLKLSSTSTLAASSSQKVLDVTLSGANANAGQTTHAVSGINTHTGATSVNLGLYGEASGGTNNYAVRGVTSGASDRSVYGSSASTGYGVYGTNSSSGAGGRFENSSSGTGLFATSSTGIAINASTGANYAAVFDNNFSTTTTIEDVIRVSRLVSGTAAAGAGPGVGFWGEAADGFNTKMGSLGFKWNDASGELVTFNNTILEAGSTSIPMYDQTAKRVQTTDNTPTTILTIPITDETAGILEVFLTAKSTGTAGKVTGKKGVGYRKDGGTLTLDSITDVVATLATGDLSTATWTITTSSNNVVVQVTGETSRTIDWQVSTHLVSR